MVFFAPESIDLSFNSVWLDFVKCIFKEHPMPGLSGRLIADDLENELVCISSQANWLGASIF